MSIYLHAGPKTNFLPHLPMAGDVIKFTSEISFVPAMKLFLHKHSVITTTMTEHIYNVLNVSFTLLKTTTNRCIDLSLFYKLCIFIKCIFSQFYLLIIAIQHYSIIESHNF